ncbi:diaminopimelate epimerase [Candidatus Paraluminiphilus aquimaris]|uniref:Diaminopimelate epimerase n=1 Tax=Candidatus Paraluminiphilus aquimaris TaxID=2518994 RepID=A0ABY6Q343_9GAMM|nr:diaminopimelate epimerase [Candidatus Paraluminiphilus aquimaris]UZP73374.1 diaminopimelate epimerase [Candidatus Paraluminiphilus aquimaris]
MKLHFTKMHGAGNDFVVIDAVRAAIKINEDQIRKIADRQTGVGCDQVLLIEPPKRPDADFEYRIFNADGSPAGQCGNGARCVGRFIHEQRLSAKSIITLQVGSDLRRLEFDETGSVKAELGAPIFAPAQIPFAADEDATEHALTLANVTVMAGVVSVGNPHAVLLVDDIAATPVEKIGPMIQSLDVFPEGVNVGFMQVESNTQVKLRVFERGAGETLACGSGACAAVIHGIRLGQLANKVTVSVPGGKLEVSWDNGVSSVWLSGPAETVFEGKLNL